MIWLIVVAVVCTIGLLVWNETRISRRIDELLNDLDLYEVQLAGLERMDGTTEDELKNKRKQIQDCKDALHKLGYYIYP